MSDPAEILDIALQRASAYIQEPLVNNPGIVDRVEFVCRNIQNRAGVRLLLSCLLAKIHNPKVDIRKPYTEIGDLDAFSGRTYDEAYVSAFINKHNLPCNSTTAFLTPALRNRNITLTPDVNLVGRPPKLYQTALQLLDDVHTNRVSAEDLLAETVRCLLIFRNEKRQRMETLLATLSELKSSYELRSWRDMARNQAVYRSGVRARLPRPSTLSDRIAGRGNPALTASYDTPTDPGRQPPKQQMRNSYPQKMRFPSLLKPL